MNAAFGWTAMGSGNDTSPTRDLRAVLADLAPVPPVPGRIGVTDLTSDSRAVRPGAAFVALPGRRTHGINHALQATQAGAAAVLWEPAPGVVAPTLPRHVALIEVPQLTCRLGTIADRFFDEPSRVVPVAGVTGTNGKSTTAWLIAAALEKLERPAAYAGTLGVGRLDALAPAAYTTPDCITVHRQLAELRDAGARSFAMEVSSHALDQRRVDGVRFDTAVFTNLTRDHLDYHGTLAAYGEAKSRLFTWPALKHAVVNADDPFGRQLLNRIACNVLVTTYSRSSAVPFRQLSPLTRHLFATQVTARPEGLEIQVDGTWGAATLYSRFVGDFNAENLLAVLAVLLGWDVPLADAVAALGECQAPPGRMETFRVPGAPLVVVDYAHTPDALEKALQAVRAHSAGRLICVFGCGGERDPGKRPLMGAVAERLADLVIVTDDNPRGENGDVIVADILSGMKRLEGVSIERDRAAAIERALRDAGAGDVVLIAGKGHEDYQLLATERRAFSDRELVATVLQGRGPGAQGGADA